VFSLRRAAAIAVGLRYPRGQFKVSREGRIPSEEARWAFVEEGERSQGRNPSASEYGMLGDTPQLRDGYMIHGTLYDAWLGRA